MMYSYLSALAADHNYTLTLSQTNGINYQPIREQYVEMYDDDTEERIDVDDEYTFVIDINWKDLTKEENHTVIDFFYSISKGYGIVQTFYWEHPTDGYTYTVRFLQKPAHTQNSYHVYNISAKLKVLGTHP